MNDKQLLKELLLNKELIDVGYYEVLPYIMSIFKSLSNNIHQHILILDFWKSKLSFVSKKTLDLFNLEMDDLQENEISFLWKNMPDTDSRKKLEFYNEAFKQYEALTEVNNLEYSLYYSCKYDIGTNSITTYNQFVPIHFAKNRRPWIALIIMTLSPSNIFPMMVFKNQNSNYGLFYNSDTHSWEKFVDCKLSKIDRDILYLSIQGLTVKDIAEKLCKSLDTIKTHKRLMFNRMGVNNTIEAIMFAQNHNLI